MANIYYNNQLVGNTDNRFSTKQTQCGSDPRINRKRKGFRIKFKYIVYFIIAITILCNIVHVDFGLIDHSVALQGPVSEVKAKSVETPVPQNTVNLTGKELYKKMIMDKFGKDGENAVKIVSQCENRAMNPSQIGDDYPIRGEHIVSVGLFQIRALPNRPSIEQLKDPQTNIDWAFGMFKAQGYKFGSTAGWYNCSRLLNIK